MSLSKSRAVFWNFSPYGAAVFGLAFLLSSVLFLSSFTRAQALSGDPMVRNVALSQDEDGVMLYFDVAGENFTKDSAVRVNGEDIETIFTDSSHLVGEAALSKFAEGDKMSVSVFNYPAYNQLDVDGSNFFVDSVVRLENVQTGIKKDLPTTYVNSGKLRADTSGFASGEYKMTVFSGEATKMESVAKNIVIPESGKPMTKDAQEAILSLAKTAGTSAPQDYSKLGVLDQSNLFLDLAKQAEARLNILQTKNNALELAAKAGLPVGPTPIAGAFGEFDFYAALAKRATARLDLLAVKKEALALAATAQIIYPALPSDDDINAPIFYAELKTRAENRLWVKEFGPQVLDLASQAGLSIPTLPAAGTAGEKDFYLKIEAAARETLARRQIYPSAIPSAPTFAAPAL